MIIDLTGQIMNSFIADPTITGWVGKVSGVVPNISANKTPSGILPAVVLYEMKNKDGEFADDSPFNSEIGYQITLFSTDGSHGQVQNNVDDIMRSLDFSRSNALSNFDEDTKTHQRVMLYNTTKSLDD